MAIAREHIDSDAEKVLRRLRRNGHAAYLVGGCVRDLLLGRTPKDFDIATSATPPEIKDLFRNCRIIGRRFRLAHIFFGAKIIETSTFRTNPREGTPLDDVEELLIRRDNVFGTAEEDARRRDFTINGLFYDIEVDEVIDYVGGLADLEARMVRTIGDPEIRFREDPVRILRAIKFAARLGFQVEPATYTAMLAHRGEIAKCAPPRVLEEIYRLLRGGAARRSMELLFETGVAGVLAPELAWMFGAGASETDPPPWLPAEDELARCRGLGWRILEELDALAASPEARAAGGPNGGAANSLLLAALVAPFVPDPPPPVEGARDRGDGTRELAARVEELLVPIVQRLRVSRRDAERARQMLLAQRRLSPTRRRRARPMALVRREYFGDALTLYELLARARGIEGDETARWRALWRSTSAEREPDETPRGDEAAATEREEGERPASPIEDASEPAGDPTRKRRRRRGGRRRRRAATADTAAGPAELAPETATLSTAGRDPSGSADAGD